MINESWSFFTRHLLPSSILLSFLYYTLMTCFGEYYEYLMSFFPFRLLVEFANWAVPTNALLWICLYFALGAYCGEYHEQFIPFVPFPSFVDFVYWFLWLFLFASLFFIRRFLLSGILLSSWYYILTTHFGEYYEHLASFLPFHLLVDLVVNFADLLLRLFLLVNGLFLLVNWLFLFVNWLFYIVLSLLVVFLVTVVLFLIFTIMAACLTLIESNILAIVQRSVGPDHIGYKGNNQFIADALNLLLNHIVVVNNLTTNSLFFLSVPALLLVVGYLNWANLCWNIHLSYGKIENNLLLMNILSAVFTYLIIFVGYVSINKYSIYSSNSVLLTSVNLEIYLSFFIVFILLFSNSFSFDVVVAKQLQVGSWSVYCFLPIVPFFILTFLLETGRIPYDYMESESELIAGVTIEYSGFYFALFYLNEYFHLITFANIYAVCLLGGWL